MTADMDAILSRMMWSENFSENNYCNKKIFIKKPDARKASPLGYLVFIFQSLLLLLPSWFVPDFHTEFYMKRSFWNAPEHPDPGNSGLLSEIKSACHFSEFYYTSETQVKRLLLFRSLYHTQNRIGRFFPWFTQINQIWWYTESYEWRVCPDIIIPY